MRCPLNLGQKTLELAGMKHRNALVVCVARSVTMCVSQVQQFVGTNIGLGAVVQAGQMPPSTRPGSAVFAVTLETVNNSVIDTPSKFARPSLCHEAQPHYSTHRALRLRWQLPCTIVAQFAEISRAAADDAKLVNADGRAQLRSHRSRRAALL